MHANHPSDFLNILAHGVVVIGAQARSRQGEQRMVVLNGLGAAQADDGSLNPAGEARELVRLDVANHNAQVGAGKPGIDPGRGAAGGGAEEKQAVLIFSVMRARGVTLEDGLRQDVREFRGEHGSVQPHRHQQGDGLRRNARRLQLLEQRGQQLADRHRAGFIVNRHHHRGCPAEVLKPRPTQGLV